MQQLRDGVEITPRWVTIDSFLIIEMTKTMPVLRQLSFEDKVIKGIYVLQNGSKNRII